MIALYYVALFLFNTPYFADYPMLSQFLATYDVVISHDYAFRAVVLCTSMLTILAVSEVYRAYNVDQGFLPITALGYISFIVVPGNLLAMLSIFLMLNVVFSNLFVDKVISRFVSVVSSVLLIFIAPYMFLVSLVVFLVLLAKEKKLYAYVAKYWYLSTIVVWLVYASLQYMLFTTNTFFPAHVDLNSSVFVYAATKWLYLDQGLSMAEPALSVLLLFGIPLFYSFRFSLNRYRLAAVVFTALVLELYVSFIGVPTFLGMAPLAFTLLFVIPFLCKYNERLNWSYYFAYLVVFLFIFISVFDKSIVLDRATSDVVKIVSTIDKNQHVVPVLYESDKHSRGYEAQTYYNYALYELFKRDKPMPSKRDVVYLVYSCDSLGDLGELAYQGCWILSKNHPSNV